MVRAKPVDGDPTVPRSPIRSLASSDGAPQNKAFWRETDSTKMTLVAIDFGRVQTGAQRVKFAKSVTTAPR